MAMAIRQVKSKAMTYGKAAKSYNINKTTLQRRVKGSNKLATGSDKLLGNKRSVLSKEIEDELFGLTTDDIRELAFQLAERNPLITHSTKRLVKLGGRG